MLRHVVLCRLMMEARITSETSVKPVRLQNIPADSRLHSHFRKKQKFETVSFIISYFYLASNSTFPK
jgi:hypothetical protein